MSKSRYIECQTQNEDVVELKWADFKVHLGVDGWKDEVINDGTYDSFVFLYLLYKAISAMELLQHKALIY